MTAKRPSHPLLRSLPVVALVAGVAAAACDVAAGAEAGAFDSAVSSQASAAQPSPAAPPAAATRIVSDTLRIFTDTMAMSDRESSLPRRRASIGFEQTSPISITGTGDEIRTRDYFRVARVRPGTGADRAGIQPGDEILTVNGLDGKALRSWATLLGQEPGTRYSLRVRRGGAEFDVAATLDPFEEGKPYW